MRFTFADYWHGCKCCNEYYWLHFQLSVVARCDTVILRNSRLVARSSSLSLSNTGNRVSSQTPILGSWQFENWDSTLNLLRWERLRRKGCVILAFCVHAHFGRFLLFFFFLTPNSYSWVNWLSRANFTLQSTISSYEWLLLFNNDSCQTCKTFLTSWQFRPTPSQIQNKTHRSQIHLINFMLLSSCFLSRRNKKDLLVLDLGCGDGLLGEGLWKRGYTNITGVDFSQPMLDKSAARKATFIRPLSFSLFGLMRIWSYLLTNCRGCYSKLSRADLLKELPFEKDWFDVLVSTAVTTYLSKHWMSLTPKLTWSLPCSA